jgi:hypothetical protein
MVHSNKKNWNCIIFLRNRKLKLVRKPFKYYFSFPSHRPPVFGIRLPIGYLVHQFLLFLMLPGDGIIKLSNTETERKIMLQRLHLVRKSNGNDMKKLDLNDDFKAKDGDHHEITFHIVIDPPVF